jgi:hypothetical protein
VRRRDEIVSGAGHEVGAMLISHDEQDIETFSLSGHGLPCFLSRSMAEPEVLKCTGW